MLSLISREMRYYSDMKLVIIRHAESNKMAGLAGEPDAPSPKGRLQLQKLVEVCRQENVEAIFHSPQSRAVFAAEALSLALSVPSVSQPGLEERSFGDWDNWEWPLISAELDKLTNEERYTFMPPNGESWQQMEERICAALGQISAKQYGSVAIVTHWGPIRVLLPMIKGESKESTLDLHVEPGESFVVDY
jgi:broad specificity phosphatase PhoE